MAAPGAQSQVPQVSQAQAQPSQAQSQTDIDPISKFKQLLLPRLKESLVNLMKVAGQTLHQNALVEDGHKTSEGAQQKFEKSLEEFYSICDQIEVNLRLALEMTSQQSDSQKFTPFQVAYPKPESPNPEGQSLLYPQYLTTVKQQIACAKEMHDMLLEHARKLSERQ